MVSPNKSRTGFIIGKSLQPGPTFKIRDFVSFPPGVISFWIFVNGEILLGFFPTLILGGKWVKLQDLLSKRSSELQLHPDQSGSLCLPASSFPWEEIVSTLLKSCGRINEIVQKINQLLFLYIKVELDRLKWLWERCRVWVMLSCLSLWGQKPGLHFAFVKCHLCCDHTPKSQRWNTILYFLISGRCQIIV